jgi:hypothetical protein
METDRRLPEPSQAQPQTSASKVYQEPDKEVNNEHINLIDNKRKETWAEVVNSRKRQNKPKEAPEIIGTKPSEEEQLRARNHLT